MRMVIGKDGPNRASFDAIQCHQHQTGVKEDDNGVDDEDDNQNDHVDDYNAFFSQGCEPFPSCCTCGQEQK